MWMSYKINISIEGVMWLLPEVDFLEVVMWHCECHKKLKLVEVVMWLLHELYFGKINMTVVPWIPCKIDLGHINMEVVTWLPHKLGFDHIITEIVVWLLYVRYYGSSYKVIQSILRIFPNVTNHFILLILMSSVNLDLIELNEIIPYPLGTSPFTFTRAYKIWFICQMSVNFTLMWFNCLLTISQIETELFVTYLICGKG